jgi:hypothetical protein
MSYSTAYSPGISLDHWYFASSFTSYDAFRAFDSLLSPSSETNFQRRRWNAEAPFAGDNFVPCPRNSSLDSSQWSFHDLRDLQTNFVISAESNFSLQNVNVSFVNVSPNLSKE